MSWLSYLIVVLLQSVINEVGPCLTAFNLDFYTDVQDLSYLQEYLDNDPRSAKYR